MRYDKGVTGMDKILVITVTSDLSPIKGKGVVTTCSDAYESADGGFITHAEKFLITQDIYQIFKGFKLFTVIMGAINDNEFRRTLYSSYNMMAKYIYSANVNHTNDLPFAFNLDNWDIIQYGILKGWYEPI